MSVLTTLGIDHTLFIQFLMFGATFFILTFGLFVPYTKALEERTQKTKGGEEMAGTLAKETEELKSQFETSARKVNSEIKGIFDQFRTEASKENEKIISSARADSTRLIDQAKTKIEQEVTQAKTKLKEDIPGLAQLMVSKLLSKKA